MLQKKSVIRFSHLIVFTSLAFTLPLLGRAQDLPQNEQAVLANKDVLQMVKLGFSAELVGAKIKSSKTQFDTSPSALIELKQNGVPESILVLMVEAGGRNKVASSAKLESQQDAARSAIKALRRLVSSTEVGISYVNYTPLVADVKTEVEDALSKMESGGLKTALQSSLDEFSFAATVWQATWRNDFVDGRLRDIAINRYGVPKRGWLKVVWRTDFLTAIWRQARNQFEIANNIQSQMANTADASARAEDGLVGAWKLSVENNGQRADFDMTVIRKGDSYFATLRSPFGNTNETQIIKSGDEFSFSISEIQGKQTLTAQIKGAVIQNTIQGNMTYSNGRASGTFPVSGIKLSN